MCSNEFPKNEDLNDPTQTHPKKKIFICEVCHKGFLSKHYFQGHCKSHFKELSFICDVCNKGFPSKYYLQEHRTSHSMELPYVCEVCKVGFVSKNFLQKHRNRHRRELSHVCELCNDRFPNESFLQAHRNGHSDEPSHVCEVCKLGFYSRSSLYDHRLIHLNQKIFICEICKEEIDGSKDHYHAHASEEDPLTCWVCSEKFTDRFQLDCHIPSHSEESKFKCDICGEKFFRKTQLASHERTHSDEGPPFICKVCNKVFAKSKYSFDRHVQAHTSDKQTHTDKYFCVFCSQQFLIKRHLNLHKKNCMKMHKQEEPIVIKTEMISIKTEVEETSDEG